MIQRIQTLFILMAVIAQSIFIFLPLSNIILEDSEIITFIARGYKTVDGAIVSSTTPLFILTWAILALTFITIFLYRKRLLQIRLCIYTMLLNVGMIGMIIMYTSNFLKNNAVLSNTYGLAMVIPLVNIILLYLAFRGIRKDEVLVKAYDRLR